MPSGSVILFKRLRGGRTAIGDVVDDPANVVSPDYRDGLAADLRHYFLVEGALCLGARRPRSTCS